MTAARPASETERRERAIRRLHQRAYTVINGFSADIPAYDDAPTALVERDMVHGTRLNVDLFFRYLLTTVMPSVDELQPLIDLAVRRHRDGVCLEDILAKYQSGTTLIWDQLAAEMSAQDGDLLLESATSLVRYLAMVTGRIAVACTPHADSRETLSRDEARRVVAVALLDGLVPDRRALDRVAPLSTAYVVVVVDPAERADPRILREIHSRTEAVEGSFTVSDTAGWTALIPARGDGPIGGSSATAEVFARSPMSVSPGFWAGASAPVGLADIPAARAEAQTLCRTARLLGRRDELCTGDSMLFAYTIAAAHAAHPYLRRVGDALSADRTAQETLWTYLDSGCSQLVTSGVMHVHRNTVAYRLNRVAKLTGHDPQTPEGSWVLSAARLAAGLTDR